MLYHFSLFHVMTCTFFVSLFYISACMCKFMCNECKSCNILHTEWVFIDFDDVRLWVNEMYYISKGDNFYQMVWMGLTIFVLYGWCVHVHVNDQMHRLEQCFGVLDELHSMHLSVPVAIQRFCVVMLRHFSFHSYGVAHLLCIRFIWIEGMDGLLNVVIIWR